MSIYAVVIGTAPVSQSADDSCSNVTHLTKPIDVTVQLDDQYQAFATVNHTCRGHIFLIEFNDGELLLSGQRESEINLRVDTPQFPHTNGQHCCTNARLFNITFDNTTLNKLFCENNQSSISVRFIYRYYNDDGRVNIPSQVAYIHVNTKSIIDLCGGGSNYTIANDNKTMETTNEAITNNTTNTLFMADSCVQLHSLYYFSFLCAFFVILYC